MSGVAGLVLLAAPARPLLDIVIEQNRRLAVLDDGKTSDAERDAINALVQQVRGVRDAATDARRRPMGLSGGLLAQRRRRGRGGRSTAGDLPMLVLQGARDIQVVDADWQRWKESTFHDGSRSHSSCSTVNHLGIAGDGDGSLAEYQQPGHVDATLIDEVAAWIKGH